MLRFDCSANNWGEVTNKRKTKGGLQADRPRRPDHHGAQRTIAARDGRDNQGITNGKLSSMKHNIC
ncbi:MAG: hypothetical protein O7D91_04320, partial [Planctomycetota bacterium]|nr:hypothetical protein [Planctomycetota bacterium]